LHGGCVWEGGEGFSKVEPDVVIEDELAIGIDVEAWDIDIPFGFEVEAFELYQFEEGFDVASDFGAAVVGKGFDNIFGDVLCVIALPDGFDHHEDAIIIAR